MRKLFVKIKDVFTKDTSSEGESAKLLIVMRILAVSIMVYCLIGALYCLASLYYDAAFCFVTVLFAYGLMLYASFYVKMLTLLIAVNTVSVAGVIGGFIILGPDVSIQNFFIVIIVTCYFSGYGHYRLKGIYTLLVFALYFMLQSRYGHMAAMIPFSVSQQRVLELLNIFAAFWCVALVCYVYSKDSQHLEGKLIEYNKFLRQQASTDTLTGLHNRRSANLFIEKLIKRNDEKGFCVCMCDIDFFKKVNDSYGHDIGDKVLAGVAQTLVENVSEDCLVSRWGGEEFLIVFPNMNGDEARAVLETIRSRVKKTEFDTGSTTFTITITYGLAEYGFDGDPEAIVKEADDKLYIGKENGRDQIVF